MSQTPPKDKTRLMIVLAIVLGLVLIALLWVFRSEAPHSKRDPNGPLIVLAPAGAVETLKGSLQSFSGPRVNVQEADAERLLSVFEGDPQAADIVLIAGESQKNALLKRGLFERVGPEPLIYDHLEALTADTSTIELAFPQHLLQPVVRGVGYLPKTEASGEITQSLLGGWNLTDRLGRRLVPCATSADALRRLAAQEISVAFIPRSEHRNLGGLKAVLNLAQHPQSAIPLYAFISLKSPKLAEARALSEALTSPQAMKRFGESGFTTQNIPSAPH